MLFIIFGYSERPTYSHEQAGPYVLLQNKNNKSDMALHVIRIIENKCNKNKYAEWTAPQPVAKDRIIETTIVFRRTRLFSGGKTTPPQIIKSQCLLKAHKHIVLDFGTKLR